MMTPDHDHETAISKAYAAAKNAIRAAKAAKASGRAADHEGAMHAARWAADAYEAAALTIARSK
jgi:hypothetical protein